MQPSWNKENDKQSSHANHFNRVHQARITNQSKAWINQSNPKYTSSPPRFTYIRWPWGFSCSSQIHTQCSSWKQPTKTSKHSLKSRRPNDAWNLPRNGFRRRHSKGWLPLSSTSQNNGSWSGSCPNLALPVDFHLRIALLVFPKAGSKCGRMW